ncbi:hypothetical protein KC351_g9633 [Hortaea werneckii]|nr:hypothetical protein KC351_g9633 [Hortaea werneckii]
MSTKDTTPMGSDAKTSSAAAAAEKKDTTRAPDVDIAKLTKAAGFNTTKTAANTWAVIKKKLLSMGGDGGEGGEAQDAPKTPKAKATPKKRGKKADADGEDDAEAGAGAEDGSPKKKQRKTPVKKGKKAEQAAEEDAAAIKGVDTDEAA